MQKSSFLLVNLNLPQESLLIQLFGCAVNWCQHWFEYFPNPPLNILNMAENVLAHHDKELLQHLVDCGVTSQVTEAAEPQRGCQIMCHKIARAQWDHTFSALL